MYSLICSKEFSNESPDDMFCVPYLDEESNRLSSIQDTVVVSQSKVHHLQHPSAKIPYRSKKKKKSRTYRTNFNLAIHGHGLVLDRVKSKNS